MKSRFKSWLVLVALIFLVALSTTQWAAQPTQAAGVWFATTGGSDSADCASPATPCATINGALNKPGFVAGDTIRVAEGIYTGSGEQVVLIDKNVTLSGAWTSGFMEQFSPSTIDGEYARAGLRVSSGVTASLDHFMFLHGAPTWPRIYGGGICNDNGVLTVTNSLIYDNRAPYLGEGGGIANLNGGTLNLVNSTVTYNTADEGGGILNYGTMTITNSIIYKNIGGVVPMIGGGGGGGIMNHGTLTMDSSLVSGNQLGGQRDGNGILNFGTLIVNNSTVSENTGVNDGIHSSGRLTLNSSTVANNTGAGLYASGSVTIQNTIISHNQWVDCYEYPGGMNSFNSQGYNLIGNNSSCSLSATDLTNIDSLLGPVANNGGPTLSQALAADSPAINAGNPAGCMGSRGLLTVDQRGEPRSGRCDIGAYEVTFPFIASKKINWNTPPLGNSLAYSITVQNIGSFAIPGFHITDTLPAALSYVNGSLHATSGAGTQSNGVIAWSGPVNAGETVTVSYGALAGPSTMPIMNSAEMGLDGGLDDQTVTRSLSVNYVPGHPATDHICVLAKYPLNPVLTAGASGAWDSADVMYPMVLNEGGQYKMWYAGRDGSNIGGIGYATSQDGITWTKYGGNPVLSASAGWESNRVFAPTVIKDGGIYKMWYVGRDSNAIYRIGYATSSDGIAWTKQPGNPVLNVGANGTWDDLYVTTPTVLKVGSTFHMWYAGNDGATSRIGHATSADGITWAKDPANPVLDLGTPGQWDWTDVYAPRVVTYNGKYMLWYSGETLPTASQTGYAVSANGTTWDKSGRVIPEGATGTFDVSSADYVSVIPEGGGFKIWYSGLNATGVYGIGYATAGLCGGIHNPPANYSMYLPKITYGTGTTAPTCTPYYTDNFSDPNSGWPVSDTPDRTYAYVGGEYQMVAKHLSESWWVTPGIIATDYTASVTARRGEGFGGYYGILFGITDDWQHLYEFDVGFFFSPQGNRSLYSIWRYDSGTWTPLQNWISSAYIAGDPNANRLKVIRNGASIAVYVNDHYLTTVYDSTITGMKRIGLSVSSGPNVALDVRFDDFALYPADCGAVARSPVKGPAFQMGKSDIRQGSTPPGLK